jgi:hypothetical protein
MQYAFKQKELAWKCCPRTPKEPATLLLSSYFKLEGESIVLNIFNIL